MICTLNLCSLLFVIVRMLFQILQFSAKNRRGRKRLLVSARTRANLFLFGALQEYDYGPQATQE
jgi:hypothetical protein